MTKLGVGMLLAGTSLLLGACAGPVILGINLGTASTMGSVISTAATGKGLGEHALSAITEKDCAIIEGTLRSDRKVCEVPGSEATKSDFKGIATLFDDKREAAPATMLAEGAAEPAPGQTATSAFEPPVTSAEARQVESMELAAPASPATEAAPPRIERPTIVRVAAAPPAPRPKPAANDGAYSVQVGAFSKPALAAVLVRQLRDAGYHASHVSRRGMTVVKVGGFADAPAAEAAASRIGRAWRTEPMILASRV